MNNIMYYSVLILQLISNQNIRHTDHKEIHINLNIHILFLCSLYNDFFKYIIFQGKITKAYPTRKTSRDARGLFRDTLRNNYIVISHNKTQSMNWEMPEEIVHFACRFTFVNNKPANHFIQGAWRNQDLAQNQYLNINDTKNNFMTWDYCYLEIGIIKCDSLLEEWTNQNTVWKFTTSMKTVLVLFAFED